MGAILIAFVLDKLTTAIHRRSVFSDLVFNNLWRLQFMLLPRKAALNCQVQDTGKFLDLFVAASKASNVINPPPIIMGVDSSAVISNLAYSSDIKQIQTILGHRNPNKIVSQENISTICAHLVCYNALVRPNKNKCDDKADATLNRIEVICEENRTLKPYFYSIFAHKSEPCIRTDGFSFPVNIP